MCFMFTRGDSKKGSRCQRLEAKVEEEVSLEDETGAFNAWLY